MLSASSWFKGCLVALIVIAPLAAETAQDVAKVLSERAKLRAERERCLAKITDKYAKDLENAEDFHSLGQVISERLNAISDPYYKELLSPTAEKFSKVKTEEDFIKALRSKYLALAAAGPHPKVKGYKQLESDLKKIAVTDGAVASQKLVTDLNNYFNKHKIPDCR